MQCLLWFMEKSFVVNSEYRIRAKDSEIGTKRTDVVRTMLI